MVSGRNEINARWKGERLPPWALNEAKTVKISQSAIDDALKSMPPRNKELYRLIAEMTITSERKKTEEGW